MSKVSSPLECPGCKMKTTVSFKKPGLFSPVILDYRCYLCESLVKVKIRKLPNSPPKQVNIYVLGITPSPALLAMLEEEKQHQAKPVEEQGQP